MKKADLSLVKFLKFYGKFNKFSILLIVFAVYKIFLIDNNMETISITTHSIRLNGI